jgi:hypothetical protein
MRAKIAATVDIVSGGRLVRWPLWAAVHALRAIDTGADTASELGRRLSVSKQAAAKTLAALQRLG